MIDLLQCSLGMELGSTRIKAVLIDDAYHTIAAGDYEWASHLEDGLWSYTQEEIWKGLQTAYARMAGDVETAYGERLTHVGHIGFSAMMHGYLAFDKSGELLVPFRTWQKTNTHEAHEKLSELFQYNIPERWSVAHLYQAVLNHEEHVSKVDYITTLAGYVHWKLTGEKVLGVGDASGMFPIDSEALSYDAAMLDKFGALTEKYGFDWSLRDILPKVLTAGQAAEYSGQWDRRRLTPEQFRQRAQAMKQGLALPSEDDVCDGTPGEGVACRAGRSAFWINWQGGMTPCGMMTQPLFSVPELGFAQAWERTRAATERIRLPGACAGCRLKEICHACAAMCVTETGHFDTKPEYVCEMTHETVRRTIEEAENGNS